MIRRTKATDAYLSEANKYVIEKDDKTMQITHVDLLALQGEIEKLQGSRLNKLIEVQKEYIEFLGRCEGMVYGIARIHHFEYSEVELKTGSTLRDKIKELTKVL